MPDDAEMTGPDRLRSTPDSTIWFIGFGLAIALHVAANGAYETVLAVLGGHREAMHPLALLVEFGVVLLLVNALWRTRGDQRPTPPVRGTKRLRLRWRRLKPWVLAAAAAIATVAAGSAADAWVTALVTAKPLPQGHVLAGIAALTLAIVFTVLLFPNRLAFGARVEYPRSRAPEPRRCLVQFVSTLLPQLACVNGIPAWHVETVQATLVEEIAFLNQAKAGHPNWSWEMLLRAIEPHMGELELIVLICSDTTIRIANDLVAVLRRFSETKDLRVVIWAKSTSPQARFEAIETFVPEQGLAGYDFEDLRQLAPAFEALFDDLARRGFDYEDIMLDFTGGQKTSSVLCACATFNRELRAQYVQTGGQWKAISYDLSVESERPIAG